MAKTTDLPEGKDTEPQAASGRASLVDAILNAAQACINGEKGAGTRLNGLVLLCLKEGNEADITYALDRAISPKLAGEIMLTTRLAAANAYNVRLPAIKEHLNVELFVIPVMLALPGSKYPEVPRAIANAETDWLVQSFEAQGLKRPGNEKMLIAPQLWSAVEIHNLDYCKVYDLANAFGAAISNKMAIEPEKILGTTVESSELAPGHTHLCLRYLIGAFVHPLAEQLSFQQKANDEKVEAWRNTAEEHLGKQFACSVEVFYPDALYRGLENGWFHFHAFKVAIEQAHIFRKAKVLPGEITAVISLHATELALTQIRIGYSKFTEAGTPELVGGSIWPLAPFDEPADIAEFLKGAMERNGIQAVEVAPQPQRNDSDDGDGTPTFLPPSKASKPDRIAPLPASKHMH